MKRYISIFLSVFFVWGGTPNASPEPKKEFVKQEAKKNIKAKKTESKPETKTHPESNDEGDYEDEDLYGKDSSGESNGDDDDVFEPLNRILFGVNQLLDNLILKPIAIAYNVIVPDPAKECVTCFLENLNSPLVTLNFLLQGNMKQAGTTLARFVTNSTIGVLGLFDPAEEMGYHGLHTNFGDTFVVWGMGPGPYLVIPIIGPSDIADGVGKLATWYTDPLNIMLSNNDLDYLIWTRTGLTIIDARAPLVEPLDTLEDNSLDFYVAVRSLYHQQRQAKIAKLMGEESPPAHLTPQEEAAEEAYAKVTDVDTKEKSNPKSHSNS